jgi:hypothetical protein
VHPDLFNGASTFQTEYTRDAYATVLGDVRALVDKASPNCSLARKNHAKAEATSSLRARRLLNRRCASV